MAAEQRIRHVGLARILPPPQTNLLSEGMISDIYRALNPAIKVQRYGRTWRLSRPETSGNTLYGKLGFQRSRHSEEMFYDDEARDFVARPADRTEGAVSCFVLCSPGNQVYSAILVFEEKPPDIRRQSFLGAFSKFLVEADSGHTVEVIRRAVEFGVWIDEMDRITKFTGSFSKPNPAWVDRTEQVREILDETNAHDVKIEAKASSEGDGLEIPKSLLGGVVNHSDAGYGSYKATGLRSETEFTFKDGSSEAMEEMVEDPSDTAETIFQKLRAIAERVMHYIP